MGNTYRKLSNPKSEHTAKTRVRMESHASPCSAASPTAANRPRRAAASSTRVFWSRRLCFSDTYELFLLVSSRREVQDSLAPPPTFPPFVLWKPKAKPSSPSHRHKFSTNVTACAPVGASAESRPHEERQSWKKKCVFGFSKTSARVLRSAGRSAGWHRAAAESKAPTPPPATNVAQFFWSGTTQRHTARIVAAPNAMGTAASVSASARTAPSNVATPPGRCCCRGAWRHREHYFL